MPIPASPPHRIPRGLRLVLAALALLAGIGLYVTAGHAATPAKPAAFHASAKAEAALAGTWITEGTEDYRQLAGALTLQHNKVALVAPNNRLPLVGTWQASTRELRIAVPEVSEPHLRYELDRTHTALTLHYDDGSHQVFHRLPVSPKAS